MKFPNHTSKFNNVSSLVLVLRVPGNGTSFHLLPVVWSKFGLGSVFGVSGTFEICLEKTFWFLACNSKSVPTSLFSGENFWKLRELLPGSRNFQFKRLGKHREKFWSLLKPFLVSEVKNLQLMISWIFPQSCRDLRKFIQDDEKSLERGGRKMKDDHVGSLLDHPEHFGWRDQLRWTRVQRVKCTCESKNWSDFSFTFIYFFGPDHQSVSLQPAWLGKIAHGEALSKFFST